MIKPKMIEKEQDFLSSCQHQQPVCMVVFDLNLNANQRLLCPLCLADFESNKKMIGIGKVIQMIEENQNKKIIRVESNFDLAKKLQESLIRLQTNTQEKLQILIGNIEKWLQTIPEIGQKYQSYSFFVELENLIYNECSKKDEPNINSDMKVIYESHFHKIAQNLSLFEQFEHFSQCSEILEKISYLFEQQGIKNAMQPFRKAEDVKLNLISQDELNHNNKEINESIEKLKQKYDLLQKNQKELHKRVQELQQCQGELAHNQQHLKLNLQELQESEKSLLDSEKELANLQLLNYYRKLLNDKKEVQNQIDYIQKQGDGIQQTMRNIPISRDLNELVITHQKGQMLQGDLKMTLNKLPAKKQQLQNIEKEISKVQKEIKSNNSFYLYVQKEIPLDHFDVTMDRYALQLNQLKKSLNQILNNQQQLLDNKDQLITKSRQVQVLADNIFKQLNQTDDEIVKLIQQLSQLTIQKPKQTS